MPGSVSIAEVVNNLVEGRLDGLHTAMPAEVLAYHPLTQTVDVQPVCKAMHYDADGEKVFEVLPPIVNVPVAFPRGGGYFVSVPLAKGDFVWLMFSEVSLSEWRTTGQTSNPEDVTRHGLSYPVALPACWPDTAPLTDGAATETEMVLGKDDNDSQIRIGSTIIKVGRGASNFVALANIVNAALSQIFTIFNGHVHHDSGAGVSTTLLTTFADVSAARVKAQ